MMTTTDEQRRLALQRALRHSLRWAPILEPLSSLQAAERILAELAGYPMPTASQAAHDIELLAGALLAIGLRSPSRK